MHIWFYQLCRNKYSKLAAVWEMRSIEFSLNGFIEFAEFSELNICHCSKSAQAFHLGKTPIITVRKEVHNACTQNWHHWLSYVNTKNSTTKLYL